MRDKVSALPVMYYGLFDDKSWDEYYNMGFSVDVLKSYADLYVDYLIMRYWEDRGQSDSDYYSIAIGKMKYTVEYLSSNGIEILDVDSTAKRQLKNIEFVCSLFAYNPYLFDLYDIKEFFV